MVVDKEAGDAARLACPQIALPTADPHKAQIVELDVAVMAFADMPEQDRLAKAVIRRLAEGAGAGDRAAAIVEPVADDVPIRNVAHPGLPSRSRVETYHSLPSPLSHEAAPSGARRAPPPPRSGGGTRCAEFPKGRS